MNTSTYSSESAASSAIADTKDELVVLRDWLKEPDTTDLLKGYQFLASQDEFLELFQNLVHCANGKHYQIRAFFHLVKGRFPNAVWPTTQQKIEALIADVTAAGFPELGKRIAASYRMDLLSTDQPNPEEVNAAFKSLSELQRELLDCYFNERLKFKGGTVYVKIPESLDILELITDEEFGLSGLRVHFSQNCRADFYRTPKGVFGTNVEFGPPVTFLMMSIEPSSNEYRVNGKRLYEIGLPGRYNKLGEWRPLIYPGNSDHLVKECSTLSEDPDVGGVLLYMRLTGHRCIEFVLRTNMELPGELTSTRDNTLHMWKCPVNENAPTNRHQRIYDCWLELKTGTVEEIEQELSNISRLMNLLCFPFGAEYSWRNKYRMTTPSNATLNLNEADLKIVDDLLKKYPNPESVAVLELGIDWYNRGSSSTNVFTKFLCYYIALESVAVAIADGEMGIMESEKPSKAEKRAATIACIEQKHSELFSSNPIEFVTQSYFDCVQSPTTKTKKAVSAIFGETHPYWKLLFKESSDGDMSLSNLRSELAHGDLMLMDKKHEHLVRKHVYEMERITKEFLLRIWFRLQPSDKVPSWSGEFQMGFRTADPRSILVASTEKIFPRSTDWTIRPEWCE